MAEKIDFAKSIKKVTQQVSGPANMKPPAGVAPVIPVETPPVETPPVETPPAPVTPPPPAVPPALTEVPDYLLETETPPVEPPVQTPPISSDVDKNLGAMRKKMQAIEQERDQLKAQLESRTQSTDTTTLDQLKRERDEALDRIAQLDLSQDPRFQAKYGNAEKNIRSVMKRIAKEYQATEDFVDRIMGMSIKERSTAIQTEIPDAAVALAPHIAKIDEMRMQKEQELDHARSTREQLDQVSRTQREQAIAEVRTSLHSEVCRKLEDDGFIPFKTVPGNDKWNSEIVEPCKKIFQEALATNDPKIQALFIGGGAAATAYKVICSKQDAIIRQLRKQVKMLGGMGADINGQSPSSTEQPTVDPASINAKTAASNITKKFFRK